jgi:hypothetical protein
MNDLVNELKEKFLSLNITESDKIQFDNLDTARIVLVDGNVIVENEHCTQFEVDSLSTNELEIFLMFM